MPNIFVEAVTISGGRVHSETKEIVVPPEKRVLNVEVLPSQKEYKPGEKGKVKIHLTDASGKDFVGSTVLSMYDKSVEYISGGSNVGDIKQFFWQWRRHHQPQQQDSLAKWSQNLTLPKKPGMGFIGVFGASVADEMDAEGRIADPGRVNINTHFGFGGGAPGSSVRMRGLAMATGAMPAAAPGATSEHLKQIGLGLQNYHDTFASLPFGARESGEAESGHTTVALAEPTIRTKFADTAKWIGSLTTN